jgi:hypothetical protein
MSVTRKKRKDTGESLFNSNKKRKTIYTPSNVFKQKARQKSRGEQFKNDELKQRWAIAAPNTKRKCKTESDQLGARGRFLLSELTAVLKHFATAVCASGWG